jgi:cell division protein FtsW (lipid II flippase)
MILSSIGEQLGWWGLVAVALALGILLRRLVVVGYRVGHSFAFHFCMGVAIVVGVQFFIIAL